MTQSVDVRHCTGQRAGGWCESADAEQRITILEHRIKIDDPNAELALGDGDIVQVGKRKFAKVKLV
ncbi:hypothetical protein ACE3MS_02445 [Paenibacillus dendritiformis]|uniref:hypothetical protein n=1 Tax=Paenibacillus dendritiformis TaxID=130049 RepID=UPI0036545A02